MTVLVSDSFNRANSTTTLGTTDSYNGGTAKTWNALEGVWGISNNEAYLSSSVGNFNVACIDAGTSDVTVKVVVGTTFQSAQRIALRVQDTNNFISLSLGTNYNLYRVESGSGTMIMATSEQIFAGDVISITLSGSNITVNITGNGKNYTGSVSEPMYQTNTKFGISANNTNGRFDNFQVDSLYNTVTSGPISINSTSTISSIATTRTFNSVLASDSFNRASSTTTLGTTDSYNGGLPLAWSVLGQGSYGIDASGQAYSSVSATTGHNAAVVDVGKSDCTVSVTISVFNSSEACKLSFRVVDAENMLMIEASSSGYNLYQYSGGTSSTLITTGVVPKSGDVISVVLNGASITAYCNGIEIIKSSVTFNQTATKHGIMAYKYPNTRFDNFRITSNTSTSNSNIPNNTLSMDGASDYIALPSMTITEIDIDLMIPIDIIGYGALYDSASNSIIFHDDHISSDSTFPTLTPPVGDITTFKKGIKVTQKGQNSTAFTSAATIFRHYATSDYFLKGYIYDIKCYNGAALVAHYDMSMGNVKDQTGNGYHATLYGGTFYNNSSANIVTSGAIGISGASTITATGSGNVNPVTSGSISISGLSAVTANGVKIISGSISIVGLSSIAANAVSGNVITSGTVTIGGLSTTTANGVKINRGIISIGGLSTITVNANLAVSYYLSMNGINDYILLPSMTITEVDIDLIIPGSFMGYSAIYDSPNNSIIFHDDHISNTSTFPILNPAVGDTTTFKKDIRLIQKGSNSIPFTTSAVIFRHYATSDYFQKGSIYSIKCYNGTTLVAHYDMTTKTLQDQTGNGYNATLYGGSWVGSSVQIVNSGTISISSISNVIPDNSPPVITATPSGGSYAGAQNITLSSDKTSNIYYTIDGSTPSFSTFPTINKLVMVIMENHALNQLQGNTDAPYLNSLMQQGANFQNSFAIEHPSQPNYFDLFSGSNQGVTDDNYMGAIFNTPNLYTVLNAKGKTFGGYSEDMPSVGYTGDTYGEYASKHNPWSKFSNVPASVNMPLVGYFPTSNFSTLPDVSMVVPNLINDIHDGTISQGDIWLKNNIDPFVQWAKNNNSLLIITFDEDDDSGGNNKIPTIFVGPMVKVGNVTTTYNHYNVLRTIEDLYGTGYAGNSATASPITEIWTSQGLASGTSLYTSPIQISSTKTLKYFGRSSSGKDSIINSQTYTISGPVITGTVSIGGSSTVTANGINATQISVSITGASAVQPAGVLIAKGTASITGTSTVQPVGILVTKGIISIGSIGTVTASVILGSQISATAIIQSTSLVNLSGTLIVGGIVSISGTSTLNSISDTNSYVVINIIGTSRLQSSGSAIYSSNINFISNSLLKASIGGILVGQTQLKGNRILNVYLTGSIK